MRLPMPPRLQAADPAPFDCIGRRRGDLNGNGIGLATPPMQRESFHIRELDCAEEIALLRKEFSGRPGIADLDFDLLRARMTVGFDPAQVTPEHIVQRVAALGMTAKRWTPAEHRDDQTSMRERWRLLLTCAAGLCAAAGFFVHWMISQSLAATLGGHFADVESTAPMAARALYLVSIFCGLWFVAPRALAALRRLRADMNLLMCIAVAGAIVLGEWFEAASVSFLFALALLLEHWSTARARRAIESLIEVSPQRALCKFGGQLRDVPVAEVQPGAIIVVRPGEKIPLDGRVTEGRSSVNQAPITGESAPVGKAPGDEVFAGTVNGEGLLEFQADRAADDTTLARMIRMVEESHARRAPAEQWVERFARIYTPCVMALAVAVAVVPPLAFSLSWAIWIYNSLVLLVIACPCALVISTPVSIISALASAARNGVLIKGGKYLEACAGLQAVALDKTGTLTYGKPTVEEVVPLNGFDRRQLIAAAASLELHSPHPFARAILRHAEREQIDADPLKDYQDVPGQGAEGAIGGRRLWIGGRRFGESKVEFNDAARHACAALEDRGRSVVAVGDAQQVIGLIGVADQVRNEAAATVQRLRDAGIRRVCLITGDNEQTARAVAERTGIDEYYAAALPAEKVKRVEELRDRFGLTAMVGDGVNDSPAMAAANVGIAMGAIGSDAAIETADVALMSDDLSRLPWLVQHARRTVAIIRQNIVFALGLKILFVVLAMCGFASLWMAIAADMGASLLVIFNALRLLR